MRIRHVFTIYATSCAFPLFGQNFFQNLNFDSAKIPRGTQPGASLTTAEAFPGWSVSEPTEVSYDAFSFGGTGFSIIDSKAPYGFAPLAGSFSAFLFAGVGGGVPTISQAGFVPIGSKSILMDFAFPYGVFANAPTTVTMGGQEITMAPLQTFSTYTVYGGDVSAYAGQSETLAITQVWNTPNPPVSPPSALEIDNIQFSTSAIPEPGTWTLLMFGAAVLGGVRYANSRLKA